MPTATLFLAQGSERNQRMGGSAREMEGRFTTAPSTAPASSVAEVVMDPFSASDPLELSAIRRRAFSNFDITAERQRILVTVAAGSDVIGDTALGPRFNVVLNWFEELKHRVPTGR